MRKKKHHEEHADEAWLLPYADLLTLLLALFIVMYAIGSTDKEKFEKLSEQFNSIFSSGSGVMTKNNRSTIPLEEPNVSSGTIDENSKKRTNERIEEDKMTEIKRNIEKEIDRKGYTDQVKVILNNEGLEITIQNIALFRSGDSEVIKVVYPMFNEIMKMLKKIDNSIKIVGHTDNVPIHSSKYRSNWDLSAFRAINVMNFMISQGKLDPERLSIQAFGEFKPKAPNSTEAGRSKNRRVEIYIARKYPIDESKKN